MAIAVLQATNTHSSTATVNTFAGSAFTIGAGNFLVAVIHGFLDTSATVANITTLTFNGVAMNVRVNAKAGTANRCWSAIATLNSPTTGALSLVTTELQRAMRIDLYELSGVDLDAPVSATSGSGAASGTTAAISAVVANADSLILSAVGVQGDAGTFVGSNGVTIGVQGITGVATTSDVSGASGYEAIASPATTGHDYTWTTTNVNSYAAIVINQSVGGGGGSTGIANRRAKLITALGL